MNEQHDEFERDVVHWLRGAGWVVPPSITYHDVFEPHVARALSARFDPTSLSIRGQADRVAFLLGAEQSVRVEIKTVGPRHTNLAVELFPLCEHLSRARMGCECVYAVQHAAGREYGFRVGADLVNAVSAVLVPYRWSPVEMADLVAWTSPALAAACRPRVKYVRVPDPLRGSGDPFVVFPAGRLERFADWRECFESVSNESKGAGNAKNPHNKA